jgi:Zn finger protein HypA/HybF involved in hydrogenase expression
MSDVVNLADLRAARKAGGWSAGAARCLGCRYEWAAVAPGGTVWLDCPACTLTRGRFVAQHEHDGNHWHCFCGNELFYVMSSRVYCPNCGADQVKWEDGE